MIYLQDNPLLREPLKTEHIKNRLLGHWGSSPGLSFIYLHLNRLIKEHDLRHDFSCGTRARRTRGSRSGLSLLSVADHCLRSENYVNVIVCDKQKHLQYLTMDQAITIAQKESAGGNRRAMIRASNRTW
jgi:phosphoketolase